MGEILVTPSDNGAWLLMMDGAPPMQFASRAAAEANAGGATCRGNGRHDQRRSFNHLDEWRRMGLCDRDRRRSVPVSRFG